MCIFVFGEKQATKDFERKTSAAAISFEVIVFICLQPGFLFVCLFVVVVVAVVVVFVFCFDIWGLSLKAWPFPLVASI